MAEMNPVDAVLPPCSMDVTFELQEGSGEPLSSSLQSDDYVFVENKHPNKLLEGLNRLRLNNSFCDVILCCGGQEFPCHRNVLASFSSYFEAMFTVGMMESKQERVIIKGVEPQMIGVMVKYAYTSEVVISTANVQALLAASNLLNVMAVQDACCYYIECRMDEKNCVAIHSLAETYSCKMLAKRSKDYILEHFSVIHQQEEFLSLCVDKLTEILASDDLNVAKEEMVFEAAMSWLNKCPSRRLNFEKVLEQIRLPLISPSYLHDVIEPLDEVKESQVFQRLISEAKNQDLLPYSHRAQPRLCTVPEVIAVGVYAAEDNIHCLDPLTLHWRTLRGPPSGVLEAAMVVSGSTLYLAGGHSCLSGGHANSVQCHREMWCYECSHDSWLQMAPMNEIRADFGGGSHSVERFDPTTNNWQLMDSVRMPHEVIYHTSAVALDGLIYVLGMELGGSGENYQLYEYNPRSSEWTTVYMHKQHSQSAVCTLNGKIYVIGGNTNDVVCYNPQTDLLTICAPLRIKRLKPGVAVMDGNIYVLGWDPKTIERYCDKTDTWEIVGELPNGWTQLPKCVSLRRVSLRLKCVSLRLRMAAHTANKPSTADTVAMN